MTSNAAGSQDDRFVDLHVHSFHSGDGEHSPEELFELADGAGIGAFAISDHDSLGAIPRAMQLSRGRNYEFIPSIELTTDLNGSELHILGPMVEPDSPLLEQDLDRQSRARTEQARERIHLLGKLGFQITFEEASARSRGSPPSGTTIAAVLLDKNSEVKDPRLTPYISGSRSDMPEIRFYQDFMAQGASAYVPRNWMDVTYAIDLLLRCGAVPTLAHPGAGFFSAGERIICSLKEAGLMGIEVFTPYHDEKASLYYLNLAKRLTLIPTAGSDFHGRLKPHVAFGSIRAIGPELIAVLKNCRRSPISFDGDNRSCN